MNFSRRHLLEVAASLGVTAVAGGAARAAAAPTTARALSGAWQLETFVIDAPGAERPRFGPHPAGYLLYTPSGRMAAVLMGAHRDRLEAPNGATSSRAELDESLGNFLSYAGTYEVRGSHVFHHVEVSVFTNLVGTTLERAYTLDGDTLTIRTLPPEIWGTSNRLTWKRA